MEQAPDPQEGDLTTGVEGKEKARGGSFRDSKRIRTTLLKRQGPITTITMYLQKTHQMALLLRLLPTMDSTLGED